MHKPEYKGILRAHVDSKLNFQVHDVFCCLDRNSTLPFFDIFALKSHDDYSVTQAYKH